MMLDVLVLGLLILSFAVLVSIVVRKLIFLRTIDPDAAPHDRVAAMKGDLIANRLYRKLTTFSHQVSAYTQPVKLGAKKQFHRLRNRVEQLEREYRVRETLRQDHPEPEAQVRVQALLNEADHFVKEGTLDRAEQAYIEIVSLQPRTPEAFQGLGEIYLQKKDYAHAAESLEHATRLAPRMTAIYIDLARMYQETGFLQKALAQCQKAVEIEPNDPKSLDALLEVSIALGKKQLATETLTQLEMANPDNQKLSEFRERIAAITEGVPSVPSS
ncbi:MAG: tetratricopeptide repeat protein [bacterium]